MRSWCWFLDDSDYLDNLKANGAAKDRVEEHIIEVAIAYQGKYDGVKIPLTKLLASQLVSSLEEASLTRTPTSMLVEITTKYLHCNWFHHQKRHF